MDDINASTALCALIGNPVKHSISPLIHNHLSKRLGINLVYTAFPVEPDNLKKAVEGAYALTIKGMNVTVPYKRAVMEYLADVDPLAATIGAVNTLVRVPGGYKGYNTDYLGLKRQLYEENIPIKDKEIVILGAGGASRAITFMCAAEGAARIYLMNRTFDNAKRLAEDVNAYQGRQTVVPMTLPEYRKLSGKKYTVIQTTSKGLYPDVEGTPVEDEAFYDLIEYAVDIIFNPAETKFMKMAKAHGAAAKNGLGMLLYQAVAAYELWNGIQVPEELCRELYEIMRREMARRG